MHLASYLGYWLEALSVCLLSWERIRSSVVASSSEMADMLNLPGGCGNAALLGSDQ